LSSATRILDGFPSALNYETRHQGRGAALFTGTQNAGDGFMQFGLANGLQQIGSDTQLPAALGVAGMPGGSEHHDSGGGKIGLLADVGDQIEAIHIGHVHVRQDQLEWRARIASGLQGLQRLRATIDGERLHMPMLHHGQEDALIR
jgi:hypothetical protein